MASINLSSFAGAGAQFFDNNGAPLVGGLLYVYTAGTTTPATTYTTSAGTVSNTNPIVLDSAGRTPNEVWVNGGVLYKFVLKTSTGVTIGTYDSIPSIDDPTAFNNIITVTGTNTLIGSSTPPNTAYTRGMTLSFVVVNTNTGAVTIDVDGLGAKEITFAGSAPLIAGQLTIGAMVVIEYDGTRFQLMNSSGALAITASSINGGPIAGFRNRIINGAMRIAQRGTSSNAGGYGSLDRWYMNGAGIICTLSQQTATVNGVSTNVMQYAGVAGNTAGNVQQKIESVNCYDLVGKPVTIGFWVYQNTGSAYSFQTGLNYANTVDNFSTTTAITSNTTSIPNATWTYVSFTTPALPANAANGLMLQFFNNSPAFTANMFQFAFVQLEQGAIATPFENRPYGTELALCQRYFERTGGFLQASATGYTGSTVGYAATKRAAPTVVFISTTYLDASTLALQGFGVPTANLPFNVLITNPGGYVYFIATASAEL